MTSFVINIISIIIVMVLMFKLFSKYEWRLPLLEISEKLAEDKKIKKLHKTSKYRIVFISVLFFIFFVRSSIIVLRSNILQEYQIIKIVIFGIIGIWFLKGIYGLVYSAYSIKAKLLNYLYSPYFFVWREDMLSKYGDKEIVKAIIKICHFENSQDELVNEKINLPQFLLLLCKKTRPYSEYKNYPRILKRNIKLKDEGNVKRVG